MLINLKAFSIWTEVCWVKALLLNQCLTLYPDAVKFIWIYFVAFISWKNGTVSLINVKWNFLLTRKRSGRTYSQFYFDALKNCILNPSIAKIKKTKIAISVSHLSLLRKPKRHFVKEIPYKLSSKRISHSSINNIEDFYIPSGSWSDFLKVILSLQNGLEGKNRDSYIEFQEVCKIKCS